MGGRRLTGGLPGSSRIARIVTGREGRAEDRRRRRRRLSERWEGEEEEEVGSRH